MKKNIQEYLTYVTPKFVFIPFDDMNKLRIKRNKVVFNNMFLGNLNNEDNIYSPVSGNIIGIKDMVTLSGSFKTLVIENDFVDRREKINFCKSNETLRKLKKSEVNELLGKFNLNKKFSNKKNLLINSMYNKLNDLGDMVLNYEEYEVLLETIDLILEIYDIKNSYINIPKGDLYSDFAYNKYINAFDSICIINNTKKLKMNEVISLSVLEVYKIYKALYKEYYHDTMFITIYDDKSTIVKVKEYTSLTELFKDLKISYKGKSIYVNDKLIENAQLFVLTSDVKNIVIK